MSRKFKIRDQEAVHFVIFTTLDELDVFIRPVYRYIFLESLAKETKDWNCMLYDEQPRTLDHCQAWQTKLGSRDIILRQN